VHDVHWFTPPTSNPAGKIQTKGQLWVKIGDPATEPAMSGHISAANAAATGSVGAPF